jgi:hypothetical protein
MRRLSFTAALRALTVPAGIALLVGCSGGGSNAIAPKPTAPHGDVNSPMSRALAVLGRLGALNVDVISVHHYKSYDACPATGPIKYASDDNDNVINIYTGTFAGQAPCGQIASGLLNFPFGLYVKTDTHDLYVANEGDVLVFHRGKTTPYNAYVDPSIQATNDVTVAKDGTVIASNLGQIGGPEAGSISTWLPGPSGGTFVGNFPMTNDIEGGFITVQKNGLVYFNDQDATTLHGVLWSTSCPAGACGAQTQIAGVSFGFPGGLGSDATEDLIAADSEPPSADTFELPNPNPKTFPLTGIIFGMAINQGDNHWFVADALNNYAAEYSYPGGKLVGTVPGNFGGNLVGIAIDPGHPR